MLEACFATVLKNSFIRTCRVTENPSTDLFRRSTWSSKRRCLWTIFWWVLKHLRIQLYHFLLQMKGKLFYKYGAAYREIMGFPAIDACSLVKNAPDNKVLGMLIALIRDSMPGVIHPCPYNVRSIIKYFSSVEVKVYCIGHWDPELRNQNTVPSFNFSCWRLQDVPPSSYKSEDFLKPDCSYKLQAAARRASFVLRSCDQLTPFSRLRNFLKVNH